MKREKVYLLSSSVNTYRPNEPAEIIGIEMYTPEGLSPKLCTY